MAALRITAARALTVDGWRDRVSVVVADGVITGVDDLPADLDHEFELLAPGFVDLQVNGVEDVDVATADGEDWTRLDALLAVQGVTTWCPTLVTTRLERYDAPLRRIAEAKDRSGPRPDIAGAHLEGPFLGAAAGAHPPSLIRPIDLEWIDALPTVVAMMTIGAEQPEAAEATRRMVERGMLVSIGHSRPTREQFDAAVSAGARLVTHLFNGMSGVHHREPGLAAFALTDDRVCPSLIADGIHVDRTAMALAWRARPDGIVLVTDAVAWRAGTVGAIGMAFRDGAPRLQDGTLAGSALTMDAAVRRTAVDVGVPLDQVLTAASARPAHLLGLRDRGILDVGLRADLVALDADLSVVQTWSTGQALLEQRR